MKAIIYGEKHTSTKDQETVKSLLKNYGDALFVEGRSGNVKPDRWSLSYVMFLLGAFLVFYIEDLFRPDTIQTEKPKYNDIDLTLPDFYYGANKYIKIAAAMIGLIFVSIGVFKSFFPMPLISAPLIISKGFTVVVKIVATLGGPIFFSFILIDYDVRFAGRRDDQMAKSIHEISREHGYDIVVISCGQKHVTNLKTRLEEYGWETEIENADRKNIPRIRSGP